MKKSNTFLIMGFILLFGCAAILALSTISEKNISSLAVADLLGLAGLGCMTLHRKYAV